MAWLFLYCFTVAANSVILTANGFGIDTWQYWLSSACVMLAYVSGREHEKSLK